MGMDNPNHLGYLKMVDLRDCKWTGFHKEELYEEEPPYEKNPSKLGAKNFNITSSTTFDITPPQEEDNEEVGDDEEEGVAMDEVNEEGWRN
jgi:hypothetical protein